MVRSKKSDQEPSVAPAAPPAPPAPKGPSIELSTLGGKDDDFVTIDGTRYDLLGAHLMGLRLTGEVDRLWKRICTLEDAEEQTPADDVEYETRLRALGKIVLPEAPAAVIDAQHVGNLRDLAITFFVLAAAKSPRMALMLRLAKRSTG